jgi:hypothetical protein
MPSRTASSHARASSRFATTDDSETPRKGHLAALSFMSIDRRRDLFAIDRSGLGRVGFVGRFEAPSNVVG